MNARTKLLCLKVLSVAATLLSSNVHVTADQQSPRLAFSLTGYPSPEMMRVQLELGEGVTKAVRVYALPSNKLLAVYTNSAGPEPVERSEWFLRTFPPATQPIRFPAASYPFKEGRTVTISTERPEPSDTAIAIHVYGLWLTPKVPNTVVERDGGFTVLTNPANFSFRVMQTLDDTQLCCGPSTEIDGSCKRDCTSCRAARASVAATRPTIRAAGAAR